MVIKQLLHWAIHKQEKIKVTVKYAGNTFHGTLAIHELALHPTGWVTWPCYLLTLNNSLPLILRPCEGAEKSITIRPHCYAEHKTQTIVTVVVSVVSLCGQSVGRDQWDVLKLVNQLRCHLGSEPVGLSEPWRPASEHSKATAGPLQWFIKTLLLSSSSAVTSRAA